MTTTVSAGSAPRLAAVERRGRRGSGRRRPAAPAASTARQRSASPSRARPRSAPAADDRGAERSAVRRPAAVVDVGAVGGGVDHRHVGAHGRESRRPATAGARRRWRRRATIRRPSSRRPSREPRTAPRSSRSTSLGGRERNADAGAGERVGPRTPSSCGLDRRLDLVGELAAAGGEQLDAVVVEGVVRRRDDGAGDAGIGADPGDRRRRRDAEQEGVDALGRQPGDEGGLQHRPGTAGVAPDGERRAGAEDPGRGAAEGEGELGGQLRVGDARERRRCPKLRLIAG